MSSKNTQPLTCVIDRFEDGQAVLIFEFSQNNRRELVVPRRYLPKNVQESDILHLEIYNEIDAKERNKNLARKVLEEILQGQ